MIPTVSSLSPRYGVSTSPEAPRPTEAPLSQDSVSLSSDAEDVLMAGAPTPPSTQNQLESEYRRGVEIAHDDDPTARVKRKPGTTAFFQHHRMNHDLWRVEGTVSPLGDTLNVDSVTQYEKVNGRYRATTKVQPLQDHGERWQIRFQDPMKGLDQVKNEWNHAETVEVRQ